MSSRCRRHAATAALLLGGALVACEREERNFQTAPPTADPTPVVQTTDLHAGPGTPAPMVIAAYQENRWAVGEGKRLFTWYNCSGCHAPGGGGGMGVPLIDYEWRYGSEPQNIFETIQQGRPNGMPSFRGRINADDTWKLVAWVRTLGGLTPRDVWPARGDEIAETQIEQSARTPDSSRIPPESRPPRSSPPPPRPSASRP